MEKARAFCGRESLLIPVAVDRQNVASAIEGHRPAILVDASGPFQAMDYAVAKACIAAGIHYLDIADARDFVCGIKALDEAARAACVVVISGASSVPALSGAVVGHLSAGMETVRSIEMAISASNRATAGPAVAAAILGQVGRAVKLWNGNHWRKGFAWQDFCSIDFTIPGSKSLRNRWVGLIDVPDLGLLPDRVSGRPAVTFRAGTELAFQNFLPWLASWPVRWGWLQSLSALARWLKPLQRLTAWAGSDRSGMTVRVFGFRNGNRVERNWTLIASNGDGPEIPALTIPLLVARILGGREASGARDAGQSLDLSDYQFSFDALAIRHEASECALPPSLYARVLGERFMALPPVLQSMHDVLRTGGASGEAIVAGANNPIAEMIARVVGFPPAGNYRLRVDFAEQEGVETWTRTFGRLKFHSRLHQRGQWIVERFGPLAFAFDLPSDDRGLSMIMRRWWIGPLRMPLFLAPRSLAREWEDNGRFCFDVPIALPLIGRIVHYSGWLNAPGSENPELA